jgi:inositol transport system substrate-binding protein
VDEAKKYKNIDLKVFDGQANDDTENSLIENAITNKFDVIIIQPNNGESQRSYAVKIEQAAVSARAALKQVPQNAKVVVLNGPPGNFHADSSRVSWQNESFARRSDVKIVGEQIAHWNKGEAMRYTEDWAQANPKIDAIVSMNNPKYKVPLSCGVDGTAEACLLIKQGLMTSTCLQSAYALAEKILDTTNKLVTGKAGQINVDIDASLVTKANVDQYIAIHKMAGAIK